jgi:ketosteroid isomerase-like protein
MHKLIPFTIAAVAAFGINACTKSVEAAAADPAQIEQSIRAQEAQWQKDYAAKDISALAGHYTEDATLVSPGDPVVASDIDRRKQLAMLISDPNLKLSFAADRVDVAAVAIMQ